MQATAVAIVPAWVQILSAFATPLIALVAGLIAWRQWRTAHTKLVLDLFDKRFAAFSSLTMFVYEAFNGIRNPASSSHGLAQAEFLFTQSVFDLMKDVHSEAEALLNGARTDIGDLDRKYVELKRALKPYMQLTHGL